MNIGIIMYQTSESKGQELVAQRMTKAFRRLGVNAYLITGPYHDGKRIVSSEAFEKSLDGYVRDDKSSPVPLLRVDGYISNWPPRRIMFRNFIDALRGITDRFGIDVLIAHSTLWNGPEDAAKFVLWKKTLKELGIDERRMVYCHMPHYQPPEPVGYRVAERSFRMAWNRLVFPQIFRTARLILVTTPIEMEDMVRMGAKEEQCHLFPGGLDEQIFSDYALTDFERFRKNHGIPENRLIVSYLGTVEERKNPLAVAKVARRMLDLSEVHFIIAGRGSNQERQVMNEIRGLKNVSYVGEISEEEKVQLIKGSYLNILMSRMEALGLTQIEFMYGGVPVITSAIGGQRWLVRDKMEGIHVNGPEDLDGVAQAIRFLVKNPDARSKMSVNARRRAEEFTLDRSTRNLEERLRTALQD